MISLLMVGMAKISYSHVYNFAHSKYPGPDSMTTQTKPLIIGTPLTPSAIRVMLLGSGELGKEVIIALQRLGVEIIAVDRYANAPGQQVAHRAHVINMIDGAALRALIEQEKPHLVVPEIEAIATDMLVEIEREGWREVIPTARAARLTMNREGIRRLAAESWGCRPRRIASPTAWQSCRPRSRRHRLSLHRQAGDVVLRQGPVEGGWPGRSCSRLGLRRQRRPGHAGARHRRGLRSTSITKSPCSPCALWARTAQVETHFCEPIGHVQVQWRLRRKLAAAGRCRRWRCNASRDIAEAVTDNLGGRGIFGVELFIKGDEVWFSEVSPRPHDTGMVTMCSQRHSEFELHARAILGLPVDVEPAGARRFCRDLRPLEEQGIAFAGVEEALRVPQSDLRLFGKPESFTRRRMGVALANGKDVDEARERAKLAASKVRPVKP